MGRGAAAVGTNTTTSGWSEVAGTQEPGAGRRATTGRSSQPVLLRFLEAVDDRVAPTELLKPTLTALCHTLEDQVLAEDVDGTVIAGFQRARYWATERHRYEALIDDPRRHAIVFTADDDGVTSTVDHVVVGEEHDLAREWFVLALTSGFSAVVLGRELSRSREPDEHDRRFLAIWSFDPTVVGDLLELVFAASADLGPACTARLDAAARAMPPRVPEPLMAQRFTNEVFERLEGGTPVPWEVQVHKAADSGIPAPGDDRISVADDHTRRGSDAGRDAGIGGGGGVGRDNNLAGAAAPGEPAQRVALIVDDEPGVRGLEEALLRRDGWVVHAVATAQDGREVARDHAVDVLLLDSNLAGRDGDDLVAELDRLRPGIAARTVIVADDPSQVPPLPDRPVIRRPVVWAELRDALDQLASDGGSTAGAEPQG